MFRVAWIFLLLAALPLSATAAVSTAGEVETLKLSPPDPTASLHADEQRVAAGRTAHFAEVIKAEIAPWKQGTWDVLDVRRARWRLRISSPGALSLSIAFRRFKLPVNGRLTIFSETAQAGPYFAQDREPHGELWTPPLDGEELLLELIVPIEKVEEVELLAHRVHYGYAGFGEEEPKSGACEVDVACVQSDAWIEASRAVALLSIEGVRFCTGFLINNTAMDGRPFFITAHHCGVHAANAASVTIFWNHQRSTCGKTSDLAPQTQTGAVLRASWPKTDMTLLELDDVPDPGFDVLYAGWDRSAVEPQRTAVIHHPNTDFKRIAFDLDRATATKNLQDRRTLSGDHLRIGHWETGTTEGGSSGAPLFNQDLRVVGQLQGGYAACGIRNPDWFGRFHSSWTGGGRKGLRLSDWLDPLGSGALVLDGLLASELLQGDSPSFVEGVADETAPGEISNANN